MDSSGPADTSKTPPLVSFIVPAWNEEALIGRALRALRRSAETLGLSYEIIVVDDGSTDATARIAGDWDARILRVEHRQIAAVRNAGAYIAQGEIFIFVDADTVVNPEVIRAALAELARGAVGGGCVFRFDGAIPLYAQILERVTMWGARRLRLASGCFVFCARSHFVAVGGFDSRLFAAEEWALSVALQRRGRFVVLRERVSTSGRKVRAHSAWEILGLLARVALRGPGALRDRAKLQLWYGDRRIDHGQEATEATVRS